MRFSTSPALSKQWELYQILLMPVFYSVRFELEWGLCSQLELVGNLAAETQPKKAGWCCGKVNHIMSRKIHFCQRGECPGTGSDLCSFGAIYGFQKWCVSKYGRCLPRRLLIWLFVLFLYVFQWPSTARKVAGRGKTEQNAEVCSWGLTDVLEAELQSRVSSISSLFSMLLGAEHPEAWDMWPLWAGLGDPFISSTLLGLFVNKWIALL